MIHNLSGSCLFVEARVPLFFPGIRIALGHPYIVARIIPERQLHKLMLLCNKRDPSGREATRSWSWNGFSHNGSDVLPSLPC